MQTIKNYSLLLLLLFFSFQIFAKDQKPSWINYAERNASYPRDKFLVGWQVKENVPKEEVQEARKELTQLAKVELAEGVYVKIESVSKMDIGNASGASFENFKQNSTSFSKVNINGVQQKYYYDEKNLTLYVLVYANIAEVIKVNQTKITALTSKLSSSLKQAKNNNTNGNAMLAKKELNRLLPVIREIEEIYTVSITLGQAISIDYEDFLAKETEVSTLLNALNNRNINTVSELSVDISMTLSDQLQLSQQPVNLECFTFEDTKMGSRFSRELFQRLSLDLGKEAKFIVKNTRGISPAKYTITGTVWEKENHLSIISILRENESGSVIGSSESQILKSTLTENDYKPQNLSQAVSTQQQFLSNTVENSGLSMDVLTNKGNTSTLFTQGERMSLYVKANRPCFVRFIYHMADGTKILLQDNYKISPDQVNKMIKVSQEFECSAPFGVETLQAFARTDIPFEPLNVVQYDRMSIIQDDLQTINSKNRNLSQGQSEDMQNEIAFSEKRVVITTLPAQ
ncbi:hypothetical protein EI427_21735 [Flammeovirga pectinis]|uniref:DUF4384 domain-containing protein n=1 Tax=Flammeovirga pectinis TaxID=2494373 RepID=A0A3S9P9G8_9BACT|nr:hypothetical protein [Flammeovirga pectinis]AZQ64850.1 hypothetical protein EI427_21735 [Flammeovirga pectinis]